MCQTFPGLFNLFYFKIVLPKPTNNIIKKAVLKINFETQICTFLYRCIVVICVIFYEPRSG